MTSGKLRKFVFKLLIEEIKSLVKVRLQNVKLWKIISACLKFRTYPGLFWWGRVFYHHSAHEMPHIIEDHL